MPDHIIREVRGIIARIGHRVSPTEYECEIIEKLNERTEMTFEFAHDIHLIFSFLSKPFDSNEII